MNFMGPFRRPRHGNFLVFMLSPLWNHQHTVRSRAIIPIPIANIVFQVLAITRLMMGGNDLGRGVGDVDIGTRASSGGLV